MTDRPKPRRLIAIGIAVACLVMACSSPAGSSSVPSPTPLPATPAATAAATNPSRSGSPSEGPSASAAPGPELAQAWATASLIDVTTGQPFRVADLAASGRVVFLETMAIWCSNCRTQQITATEAMAGLDPGRVAWVAIDVESSETAEALAAYREQHGFPFTYAIADADYARALVADFGDVVLSPPSVNIVVVGTDGQVSHLRGQKSVEDIHRIAVEHGA